MRGRGLIDTGTLPNGDFVTYASQLGQFIRAAGSLGTGGTAMHSHLVDTTLPLTGQTSGAFGAGSIAAAIVHDHTVRGALPGFSNDPAHVVIVLAEATTATPLPGGAVAFFEITPPAVWEVLSNPPDGPLAGQFLKGGLAPEFFAHGSNTHDPGTLSFTSGVASASDLFASGGLVVPNDVHTHDVPITFSVEDQRPPYTEVIIAKLAPTGCP